MFEYTFMRDDTTEFTPSVGVVLNGKNVAHLPLFGRVVRGISIATLEQWLTQDQLAQLVGFKNPVTVTTKHPISF